MPVQILTSKAHVIFHADTSSGSVAIEHEALQHAHMSHFGEQHMERLSYHSPKQSACTFFCFWICTTAFTNAAAAAASMQA